MLAGKNDIQISIITVCKNSELYIVETIESIIEQTYANIQYIVVDGASTDNTLEILNKYKDRIDVLISEPDEGMYRAINKGLEKATGDYILVLNSDDTLVSKNVIEDVVRQIVEKRPDYFYGNLIKWKDGLIRKTRMFTTNYDMLLYSTHGTFIHHSCFFISNRLNKILGGYNLKYKYASDYDYILRALETSKKGIYIDQYISQFRVHDSSISATGKINPERLEILKQHGYFSRPWIVRQLTYYALWIYYKARNRGNYYKA